MLRRAPGQVEGGPIGRIRRRRRGSGQGQIDQFVNGLSPADIVGASNPAAAATLEQCPVRPGTTYSKSNDLDEAVASARKSAEQVRIPNAAFSKADAQAIAKVRDSRSNWTPDELAALNEAAAGTPTQRALRMVGSACADKPVMPRLCI